MSAELCTQLERHTQTHTFAFSDDRCNGAPKELERFCGLVIDARLDIAWSAEAVVGPEMTESLCEKMRRAGCTGLGFGLESGSATVLQLMRKRHTAERAEQVLRAVARAGIQIHVFLIVGIPR